MTRRSLNRTLRRIYALVFFVLALALFAKFAGDMAAIPQWAVDASSKIYELLRDMSLLIATGGVAYLTNVFQKRSNFVESLEEEWRGIVRTKAHLLAFCERPYPSTDDYLAAYRSISETIDTMRIVYRNYGETPEYVGLYPYAPLHDMRRALQHLDPRVRPKVDEAERMLVKACMEQSFFALRETFLEELDLEEPVHPLLISAGRRKKKPGVPDWAEREHQRQKKLIETAPNKRPELDQLLMDLREKERLAQPAAAPATTASSAKSPA